ncbi:putative mitotic apparatus protein p62-like protein [Rosellinia necatrix]|uniref:Putative mitotic apparatus protein p62-like protein n=1 Tax=Rosellinia necatrix TaxID=77044 RepID=A0A1W2TCD8_ROSNE|nr:putative mitotic apparatus protein p62-like protein [Rosellinia necatrix]
MAEIPVLRFPISGQEHGSFLLEVSSNGSRPLDLKLIGSESTAVFVVKLRHKKIDEYKAAPDHCTSEEWEQILTSIFIDLKIVPDIEVRADVQSDGTSVTLSFRKNIQGITQRIGSIKLEENDKTEISPFDWCVSAITSRTKVAGELAAAATRIESLEHSIEELKAQLDDFITTKEEDETQMLEKLRDLLNEKKLKIRQQQRLLAAANVDPKKLAKMGGGDGSDVHRNAGSSRSGKRKAPVKEEDDESNGLEMMDIDQDGGDSAGANDRSEPGSDIDGDQQLSTDNDMTASDPDTDDEPPIAAEVRRKGAPPQGPPPKPKASASKPTARPSRTTRAATRKETAPESDSEDADDAPPPPRSLPFMKSKKAASPPKPADDGDDETPSDDESEL